MVKKRITIMVVLVGILLATIVGTSYAAFNVTSTQDTTNVISVLNCLEIEITNGKNPFDLQNAFPIKDEVALEKTPYTFTATNKCARYVEIDLGFEVLTGSTLEASKLKTTLSENGKKGAYQALSLYPLGTAVNGGTAYVLLTDGLKANESKSYDFRMWLPYELTEEDVEGKSLNGKIIISATVKTPMPAGWTSAGEDTLIAGIRNNYSIAQDTWTIPGPQKSYSNGNFDFSIDSTYQGYYWTYADGYSLDSTTGKFNLTGVHTVLYSSGFSDLNGKYIVANTAADNSSETNEAKNTSGLTTIYQVINLKLDKVIYKIVGTWMEVDSTYQNYYWSYSSSVAQIGSNSDMSGRFNLTDIHTLKYNDDYQKLVGKYIIGNTASSNANSADTPKTFSYLTRLYRVIYAGENYLIYEDAAEAELGAAEDDYGTSYYFRGMIENNYLSFAGMCWRIVRVDGLGNTKIVLYNYNPNSASNPCAVSEDGMTNAYARYKDTNNSIKYTSAYNVESISVNGKNINSSSYNAGIGYMFGIPGSDTYDDEHANNNRSTLLKNLISWYDAELRNYNHMLADVVWCNDKSLSTNSEFNPKSFTDNILNAGYGNIKSHYGAATRFCNSTSCNYTADANPTFKCPDASGSIKNLSRFTAITVNGNGDLYFDDKEYKIGLLTLDEVLYAGAVKVYSNISYYLNKNSNSTSWWTMTPIATGFGSAIIWNGTPNLGYGLTNALAVRPAIALKPETKITSGDGTQENPFVVYVAPTE